MWKWKWSWESQLRRSRGVPAGNGTVPVSVWRGGGNAFCRMLSTRSYIFLSAALDRMLRIHSTKYCDEYICLCVCLSACEDISGATRAIFTKFFVHVACVRGSVLFWHVYDRQTSLSPGRGFLPYWKCIIGRERGDRMGVHNAGEVCYLRLPCLYFCLGTRNSWLGPHFGHDIEPDMSKNVKLLYALWVCVDASKRPHEIPIGDNRLYGKPCCVVIRDSAWQSLTKHDNPQHDFGGSLLSVSACSCIKEVKYSRLDNLH